MNFITYAVAVILHLDKYLGEIIQTFGLWSYGLLFLIIFLETGAVFAPFLPGDSLLFAAGAFAALGYLHLWWLFVILVLASILGDTVNYWVGHYLGPKVFRKKSRLFNKRYLDDAHKFYDKYGTKTIVLARFVPIIRTFAPFVAGIGKMDYAKFLFYNVIGGIAWVSLFLFGGYFFGNLTYVKEHFSLVVIIIVICSLIPLVVEYWRYRKEKKL